MLTVRLYHAALRFVLPGVVALAAGACHYDPYGDYCVPHTTTSCDGPLLVSHVEWRDDASGECSPSTNTRTICPRAGETCIDGGCVLPCESNADCDSDQVCSAGEDGRRSCGERLPAGWGPCDPSNERSCEKGYACLEVPELSGPDTTWMCTRTCETTADCGETDLFEPYCSKARGGRCIRRGSSGDPCERDNPDSCRSDMECQFDFSNTGDAPDDEPPFVCR